MITANTDFHVRLGPTKRTLTASDKWSKSFETRLEYCYDQPNVRSFESDGPLQNSQDAIATEFSFRFSGGVVP
jgi:hypothetical protein